MKQQQEDISVETRSALRTSIYEGLFSHIFATLTGGVFLTGFALYLGMDEITIGLLSAAPFLVASLQVPTAYLMGRNGMRKDVWYWGAAGARAMWAVVTLTAVIANTRAGVSSSVVIGLIFIAYACLTVSHVSWLSLMSDLVPAEIRGRYFGTRNMLCGAAGMAAMFLFGNFIDFLKAQWESQLSLGFAATFLVAVISGAFSLRYIRRVPEPETGHSNNLVPFAEDLSAPFKDANFRRFLSFIFLWNFSVHFAAPFFTLYFLRDLGFSYSFVAALGITSGTADLVAMRIWGRVSDDIRNKPVILVGGWIAVFIPLSWIFVGSGDHRLALFINIISGGFWAGINLCMNNMLLEITPSKSRGSFLSIFNTVAGLGAAAGPVLAGLLVKSLNMLGSGTAAPSILPLHVVFAASTVLRMLSLQLFFRVREAEEAREIHVVRVLRSVRGLNVAAGFSSVLHPFINILKNNRRS